MSPFAVNLVKFRKFRKFTEKLFGSCGTNDTEYPESRHHRADMEILRSEALRIFLQHELASALLVESVVEQREDYLGERTLESVSTWVKFCRNAQTGCGVFGLVAIDRAESSLFYYLQRDCSFGKVDKDHNENLARKFEKAGFCYVNALRRQISSDPNNVRLWSYAGAVYDYVDAAKLKTLQGDEEDVREECRRSMLNWKKVAESFESEAEDDASEAGALRNEIALKYRSAIAHTEVYLAVEALHGGGYSRAHAECATASAAHLIKSLECLEAALGCFEPGEEELHDLWRLCATYMQHAAEEAGKLQNRDKTPWENVCWRLMCVAFKLSSVVGNLSDLSDSINPPDLTEVKRKLSEAFKMVNECPLVTDPRGAAARTFNALPIELFIRDIAFMVEKLFTRVSPEQKVIERFLAAADKVNVDQSPAHPHIKQCWLNAAEQMRLAVASSVEHVSEQHKARSSLQEKIALGPFTTAASYFAKADRAATVHANELWAAAAQALMEAAVIAMKRYLSCHHVNAGMDSQLLCEGEGHEERARNFVAAAACCEQIGHEAPNVADHKLRRLRQGEFALRIAVIEGDTGPDAKGRQCDDWFELGCNRYERCKVSCRRLLSWCQKQQTPIPEALAPPGAPPPVRTEHQARLSEHQEAAQRLSDARWDRAIWLCGILAQLVRLFAVADTSSVVVAAADTARERWEELVNEVARGTSIYAATPSPAVPAAGEAARAFLAGNTEECSVWSAAVLYLRDRTVHIMSRVHREIYNRLVVKAWELREASGGYANRDPALLIPFKGQNKVADAEHSARIDCAAEALAKVEHMRELSNRTDVGEEAKRAMKNAAVQFSHCATFLETFLTYKAPSKADQHAVMLCEKGARAMQAGRWYAAAAQAAEAAQWEVHATFTKAASYVQETKLNSAKTFLEKMMEPVVKETAEYSDQHRAVATKAGERFARAAEALVAGDRELYELWLKAAEATAEALKGDDAVGDAEALAQAAQQRQDAVSAQLPTTNSGPAAQAISVAHQAEVVATAVSASTVGGKRKRRGEQD
jgi:hypothetical protein